jgi:DNA topoisomerase I
MDNGYTLVICEKPDAAKRVADALSRGNCKSTLVDGTTVFSFGRGEEKYVVCSAQGHVYGVSDPSDERTVYPVFDVEWYSSDLINENSANAARRISAIKKLASGASKFVNACDFDVEGETIGFNLLRYACGGKEKEALRAKFSTLTEEDLVRAFGGLEPQMGQGLSSAGRARHTIDFVWGVNLSRTLSWSAMASGRRYRTVSVGRVQGPTMGFLVEREQEIRTFVPVPYWRVSGVFEMRGKKIVAGYSKEKVEERLRAEGVREGCVGKEAVAKAVLRSTVQVSPPVPFNIGDLQKEAYREFRLAPSRTLQVAERLYLDALISYPRTGSQRLPPSIDYRGILRGIGKMPEYSAKVVELLRAEPKPVQGAKSDPAHPAIHPTGEKPRRTLGALEASVFDLVVRRFLAAFGLSAKRELVDVVLAVDGYEFKLAGGRTVFPGWMSYYGKYAGHRDVELPAVSEGDRFKVVDVLVEEKFEQRPSRYNQGSLLERMEREEIGTKATRADIIATLVGRGYVSGESMEVTDLGLAVVETLGRFAPSIIGTALTRDIEDKLGAVEEGDREAELLRETVRSIADQLVELNAHADEVEKKIGSALTSTTSKTLVLGRCPVCRTGELRIVRSRATKKRFVGCSNYSSGCRASAPLPQMGTVRAASRVCERCSWPIVYVVGARRPWRLCVNPSCPGKGKP